MKKSVLLSMLMSMFFYFLTACGGEKDSDTSSEQEAENQTATPTPQEVVTTDSDGAWFKPALQASWQWQLSGELNTNYQADIYDVDLFDTSEQSIAQLSARGIKVICYFSAGSYEEWRDDQELFAQEDLGSTLDDWEGERWVDIRSDSVRKIMLARLDLASQKGCHGVEPDNMDGYSNAPGFNLTASDQLDYNLFIADQAHARQLSVGLKNDLDQIDQLVGSFDFAVNEQCFEYDECELLSPFIQLGKPVFNAEYLEDYVNDSDERNKLCEQSINMGMSTLILPLDLDDSFRFSCI